jgi:hypothetical protein
VRSNRTRLLVVIDQTIPIANLDSSFLSARRADASALASNELIGATMVLLTTTLLTRLTPAGLAVGRGVGRLGLARGPAMPSLQRQRCLGTEGTR